MRCLFGGGALGVAYLVFNIANGFSIATHLRKISLALDGGGDLYTNLSELPHLVSAALYWGRRLFE